MQVWTRKKVKKQVNPQQKASTRTWPKVRLLPNARHELPTKREKRRQTVNRKTTKSERKSRKDEDDRKQKAKARPKRLAHKRKSANNVKKRELNSKQNKRKNGWKGRKPSQNANFG